MSYRQLTDNLALKNGNYLAPFLWLHGEDISLVLDRLRTIRSAGVDLVCLESRPHPDFCSQKWFDDIRAILDECRKLNMKAYILDDRHFPSGCANGAFVKKYPHLLPKSIGEYHVDVTGGVDDCFIMTKHLIRPGETLLAAVAVRYAAVSGVYHDPVDLSDGICSDRVRFSLPVGTWRIFLIVQTPHGFAPPFHEHGDKLNPETTSVFISEVYEPHYEHLHDYFGNTLLGFFSDEPCFGNNTDSSFAPLFGTPYARYPWNDTVFAALRERCGGDVYVNLAGLWADIRLISPAIRVAYMDIVSDLYRDCFTNPIADWCHAHGVMYIGHFIEDNNAHALTGNGPGHYFKAGERMDMAGIDVVLHQIMPFMPNDNNPGQVSYRHMNGRFFNNYLPRLAASAAAIDKNKQNRALCEIFGAYGFAEGPRTMKYLADHMLVRGLNRFVPHAYSDLQDDTDCPPVFNAYGSGTMSKHITDVFAYINRVVHMFENTERVVHAAVIYDAEAIWINKTRLPLEDLAEALDSLWIDFDIIPASSLSEAASRYDLILLTEAYEYSDALLRDIRRIHDKVRLVVMPDYERRTGMMPDTAEDGQHAGNAERIILRSRPRPACLTVTLDDLRKGIGPFINQTNNVDCRSYGLMVRHARSCGTEVYFLTNENKFHDIDDCFGFPEFHGGEFIIYDPYTNEAVRQTTDDPYICYTLHAASSVFILFGELGQTDLPPFFDENAMTVTRQYPMYRVSLRAAGESGFTHCTDTETLFNVTSEEHLPAFSGDMLYEFDVELEEEHSHVKLDLGAVGEAAEVYVNDVGPFRLCSAPFRFDITGCAVRGTNHIRVTVSNHLGYSKMDPLSSYMTFEPSGLLGPVDLLIADY